MIDTKRTQSENESAPSAKLAEGADGGDCAVLQPARWYLRSAADRDTHRGRLFGNGTVMADCGLAFRPLKALRDRGPALPGYPPDPDQVCGKCKRGGGDR